MRWIKKYKNLSKNKVNKVEKKPHNLVFSIKSSANTLPSFVELKKTLNSKEKKIKPCTWKWRAWTKDYQFWRDKLDLFMSKL